MLDDERLKVFFYIYMHIEELHSSEVEQRYWMWLVANCSEARQHSKNLSVDMTGTRSKKPSALSKLYLVSYNLVQTLGYVSFMNNEMGNLKFTRLFSLAINNFFMQYYTNDICYRALFVCCIFVLNYFEKRHFSFILDGATYFIWLYNITSSLLLVVPCGIRPSYL